MTMTTMTRAWLCCLAASVLLVSPARAIEPPESIEDSLEALGRRGKYVFLLFYREDNNQARAMSQSLQEALGDRTAEAASIKVRLSEARQRALAERFGVNRAPLPVTVAVAPNGAVTGVFSERLQPSDLEQAFVTPAMMASMKGLQDGKVVLLCIHSAQQKQAPAGVTALTKDAEFKGRTAVVMAPADDPAELPLLTELGVDPSALKSTVVALMAPPGVLVGKFNNDVTKQEMAAKLHEAGRCCADPACKHRKKGN